MPLLVKICGLTDQAAVRAAIEAGADWVGFVFFPRSPRHLSLEQAEDLSAVVGRQAARVALTVDADDATLDAIMARVDPDFWQLHGAESPDRVRQIKARYGRPVIKALGVSGAADLAARAAYRDCADHLLFDAKPPPSADRPGGNGAAFDWGLLAGVTDIPYILSGGLDPETVRAALQQTRPIGVDVSSGVESAPGRKDPARIADFVAQARAAVEKVLS